MLSSPRCATWRDALVGVWFATIARTTPIKFLLDILPLHLAYYKEGQ